MALLPSNSYTPQAKFNKSGKVKQTVYNVRDYGAKGDGSTDDLTAITDAMVAANAAGGGVVFFPSGAYIVSGNGIAPLSNVTIGGEDVSSTIKHDNSSSSYSDIGSKPIIRNLTSNITDFSVENMTFIGDTTTNSTSCAIYLDGDRDPDAPVGAPVITNFKIINCSFRNCSSLPVRIFGLRGHMLVTECEFNFNADAGFGWNEEVIFTSNHSLNSRDNGWSISRGNRKVVCNDNTSENATFWGIWLSGFGNEDGPSYVTCNGNVVINSGKSCIALINAPSNFACCGNVVDQNHNRNSNDVDGIQIRGSSLTDRASNGTVSGNTIMNASRAGISYAWIDVLSITDNTIINTGTEFAKDGITPISPTDTTTNVGILETHLTTLTDCYVDGNNIIDNRTVPYCNYDMYKIGSSGVTYGLNTSNGMRNTNNQLVIPQYVLPGNPLTITSDGPDANIDLQINNQGSTAETQIRGGAGLNIETVSTGFGATSNLKFSGGSVDTYIGGVTVKRSDSIYSSLMAFNVLQNRILTASDTTAPIYIQGIQAGGSYAGFGEGMVYKQRTVATSFTISNSDYIVNMDTSGARTVTMINAAATPGRTYIIHDGTYTAATHNITISPYTLSPTTFTDADVDTTNNTASLSVFIDTGTPFTLSTGGTLPSPLAAATTYYVTRNTPKVSNSPLTSGTITNDTSAGYIAWSLPAQTWTADGGIGPYSGSLFPDTVLFTGSITSGTKIVTASSAVFPDDTVVGKTVFIPGAGTAGANYEAIITAFTSTTQVTVATNAGTTVSGGSCGYGDPSTLQSNYLNLQNFGFAIPSSAFIEGIKVSVVGHSLSTLNSNVKVYDEVVNLLVGGVATGDNKAINGPFTGSSATYNYGSTSDTWGLALSPADINASNFGLILQYQSVFGEAIIGTVTITVYYSSPDDIKFADTQAHAYAGTALDLTTTGSGTFTLTVASQLIDNGSSYVINQNGGGVVLYSDGLNWYLQSSAHKPAESLQSATTAVNVSAATAPSSGQVLTATSTTAATWQAAAGFANPMTTLGDIIYENNTPAAARLAGNTTSTLNVLTQTGTGAVSAAPVWTGSIGTGNIVLATSPTLVTPVLGAATATSINGLTISSSTGTLTITNAKTLSIAKSLTLDGTDSTTMTFPSTSATIARTDAAQTFTGTQTFALEVETPQAITVSSNAGTADISHGTQNFTNSSAAAMTITLTATSAVDGQKKIVRIYDFSAAAQGITWVNTENSTVLAPSISNGSTTLPLSAAFMFNGSTSLWRCIAVA